MEAVHTERIYGPSGLRGTMSAPEWTLPAGFPVAVKTATVDINGSPTDLICNLYMDAVVLIATQLGTAGTVIQAR